MGKRDTGDGMVAIQIKQQMRNQAWYEFLMEKRNSLASRLKASGALDPGLAYSSSYMQGDPASDLYPAGTASSYDANHIEGRRHEGPDGSARFEGEEEWGDYSNISTLPGDLGTQFERESLSVSSPITSLQVASNKEDLTHDPQTNDQQASSSREAHNSDFTLSTNVNTMANSANGYMPIVGDRHEERQRGTLTEKQSSMTKPAAVSLPFAASIPIAAERSNPEDEYDHDHIPALHLPQHHEPLQRLQASFPLAPIKAATSVTRHAGSSAGASPVASVASVASIAPIVSVASVAPTQRYIKGPGGATFPALISQDNFSPLSAQPRVGVISADPSNGEGAPGVLQPASFASQGEVDSIGRALEQIDPQHSRVEHNSDLISPSGVPRHVQASGSLSEGGRQDDRCLADPALAVGSSLPQSKVVSRADPTSVPPVTPLESTVPGAYTLPDDPNGFIGDAWDIGSDHLNLDPFRGRVAGEM